MDKKKNYVLWVVHVHAKTADDWNEPESFTDMKHRELSQRFIRLSKKFGYTKSVGEVHMEGVIRAMRKAQEAGIKIVYEGGRFGDDFVTLAIKSGVSGKNIIRTPIFEHPDMGREPVEAFLKTLNENKIENFEVIFAGHFGDVCIYERAQELKNKGFRPYLIMGTPVVYAKKRSLEMVRKLFGKDRLITLPELRKLK